MQPAGNAENLGRGSPVGCCAWLQAELTQLSEVQSHASPLELRFPLCLPSPVAKGGSFAGVSGEFCLPSEHIPHSRALGWAPVNQYLWLKPRSWGNAGTTGNPCTNPHISQKTHGW